jgi:C4-dicarboxylate transporter DctQ subunit
MCFRFLQVMVIFIKSGELPHHDHGHVDGIEEDLAKIDEIALSVKDTFDPKDDLAAKQHGGNGRKGGKS